MGEVVTFEKPLPRCAVCRDTGWVCENHPGKPWDDAQPNGCTCGAGAPCPACNPMSARFDPPPELG